MAREATDNLYIELGYFTPEEYYTYEARAVASVAVTATVNCDAGVIKGTSVNLSGVFTTTILAVASKNGSIDMAVQATFNSNVNVFRNSSATLQNIVNLSLQAARIADAASALAASFNAITAADRTRNYSSSLAVSTDVSATATRIKQFSASLAGVFSPEIVAVASKNGSIDANVQANLSTIVGVIKPLDSSLSVTSTLVAINTRIKQFDASVSSAFSLTANAITYILATRRNVIFDEYSYDSGITTAVKKFGISSYLFEEAVSETSNTGSLIFDGTNFKLIFSGKTLTSSNGKSWTSASNNLSAIAAVPLGAGYYYNGYYYIRESISATEYEVYHSTNGTTWSRQLKYEYLRTPQFTRLYRLTLSGTSWQLGYSGGSHTPNDTFTTMLSASSLTNVNYARGAGDANGTAFAITASGNTVIVQINSPGTNATVRATISGELVRDFIKVGSDWILHTQSGKIYTSSNLISWTMVRDMATTEGILSYQGDYYWYINSYDDSDSATPETYALYKGTSIVNLAIVNDRRFFKFRDDDSYRTPILYGNSTYVAFNDYDQRVFTSDDSLSWTYTKDTNLHPTIGSFKAEINDLNSNTNLTNWGTIDFWVYKSDNSQTIFSYRTYREAVSVRPNAIASGGTTDYRILQTGATLYADSGDTNTTADAWHHIRILRSGTTASLYLDGTRILNTSIANLPTSISGFNFGGNAGGGFATAYIDEFYVSAGVVNNPADVSITVPTTPWVADENTLALFHFDNSIQDDVTAVRYGNATLSSAFSLTANLGGTANSGANLTTIATLAASADKIVNANIALSTSATLTAVATRIKALSSDLAAVASVSAAADRIRGTSTSMASVVTLSADVNVVRGASSSQSSIATIATTGLRIKQLASSLNAFVSTLTVAAKVGDFFINADLIATLSASANRTASGTANLSVQSTLTANAIKLTIASANLSANATLTADVKQIIGVVSNIAVVASASATGLRIKQISSALNSAFGFTANGTTFKGTTTFNGFAVATLTVVPKRIRQTSAALNVVATQVSSGIRAIEASASLSGVFSPTVIAKANRVGETSLAVLSTATVIPVKKVSVAATASVQATLTASARLVKRTQVNLAVAANLTALGGRTALATANLNVVASVTASGGFAVLDRYVYIVPRETRISSVTREDRNFAIQRETRTFTLGEL